jgi:O-antigen/teichoic acid export membrane protein
LFLGWVLRAHRGDWARPTAAELQSVGREVGAYSVTRLGDGPLQASLTLIGVLMAPAIGGLTLAGYVHISQTLVRITEVLVVPLSVIFLPLVARQVREGRLDEVRRHAQLVYDTILFAGAVLVAHGLVWGRPLLVATFGDRYEPAAPYLLVTFPAALPFLIFTAFRSFVDGYSVRPMNSLHLLAAAIVTATLSMTLRGPAGGMGLSIAFCCGMFLLGGLTLHFARRHFGLRAFERNALLAMALSALPALAGWPLARACVDAPPWQVMVLFVGFEISALALTVAGGLWLRHSAAVYAAGRLRQVLPGARTVKHHVAATVGSQADKTATSEQETTRSGVEAPASIEETVR